MIEDYKFNCVRVLKREDHFGELALINDAPRSLGIRVHSETCQLLKLDRQTFTRLLGDIKKHLKLDYGNKKEEEKKASVFDEVESDKSPQVDNQNRSFHRIPVIDKKQVSNEEAPLGILNAPNFSGSSSLSIKIPGGMGGARSKLGGGIGPMKKKNLSLKA